MNINKFIATSIVKNHNDGIFLPKDAAIRDKMYFRVGQLINLAKEYHLEVISEDDCFIVQGNCLVTDKTIKPLKIYKKKDSCGVVADFFFGLCRTANVIKYLSWFKHTHEDKFLYMIKCNNSTCTGIVSASQRNSIKKLSPEMHQI